MSSFRRSHIFAVLGVIAGVAFYQFDNMVKDSLPDGSTMRRVCDAFELLVLCPIMGVVAWVAAERLRIGERRLEEERGRRFHMLGRIAASVAHEIRNPLHTLHLIGEELRAESPAQVHPLVDRLDANMRRLDQAVGLVYELSRPNRQADGIEMDAVPLQPLLIEVISEAKRRHGRDITVLLNCRDQAVVAGRQASLHIAFGNLVRNAIEAAGLAPVEIAVLRAETTWRVIIANPGRLPPDVLAGAIPESSAKPSGMGIGLSITRHLLEQLGGRLELFQRAQVVEIAVELTAIDTEVSHAR